MNHSITETQRGELAELKPHSKYREQALEPVVSLQVLSCALSSVSHCPAFWLFFLLAVIMITEK